MYTCHVVLFRPRLPISLGSEVKSLKGIGILLVMYSQMTSMLYLSWAEIGTTGAPSATVPVGREGRRRGGRRGEGKEERGGRRGEGEGGDMYIWTLHTLIIHVPVDLLFNNNNYYTL